MDQTKPRAHKNLHDILSYPTTVPALSPQDIRRIIIEAVLGYIDRRIDLKTLIEVAKLIDQHRDDKLPQETTKGIQKISSLEVFLQDKRYAIETVDDTLVDVLSSLIPN